MAQLPIMSQPIEYARDEEDPAFIPLRDIKTLIAYFASAEKTHDKRRIGTEFEQFIVDKNSGTLLPFAGERSIEAILRALMQSREALWKAKNFIPVEENGHVIALQSTSGSVTLEPGGQLELSGAIFADVHQTHQESRLFYDVLTPILEGLNAAILPVGYYPYQTTTMRDFVPKSRSDIMRRYMPTKGGRGLDMMLHTCTVQANLDYTDEQNFATSFRVALAASPFVTALFATSPFKQGQVSGFLSERIRVWADTDPDRSGFPSVVFEEGFGYEAWINTVLDVPMYFIRRGGHFIDMTGVPFRRFMQQGHEGHRATVRDFQDHLTTVFTEVRAKPYLEMRSADMGPMEHVLALPALWKGLLYDEQALQEAADLVWGVSALDAKALQQDVARIGFLAHYQGRSVQKWCEDLVAISRESLRRQACKNAQGEDESVYLKIVEERLLKRQTYAEWLMEDFSRLRSEHHNP